MDKTLVIFGALLVISLLLGAGMIVTSASNAGFTRESAIKSASDFLSKEATFKFDGMQGTMTLDAQKVGDAYVVTGDFTSRRASGIWRQDRHDDGPGADNPYLRDQGRPER